MSNQLIKEIIAEVEYVRKQALNALTTTTSENVMFRSQGAYAACEGLITLLKKIESGEHAKEKEIIDGLDKE